MSLWIHMDLGERLQHSQMLFGPDAVFSHMVNGVVAFVREREYRQIQTAVEDALDSLLTTHHLRTYIILRLRDGRAQWIRHLGADSYHAGPRPAARLPLNPPHTHTTQQLLDTIVGPFIATGEQVQLTSDVLRAAYLMLSTISVGVSAPSERVNALLWDPIPSGSPCYYLEENVADGVPRRVYTLSTLEQLEIDQSGKRRNPFTQQPFNFRTVRRASSD